MHPGETLVSWLKFSLAGFPRSHGCLALALSCVLLLSGCASVPSEEDVAQKPTDDRSKYLADLGDAVAKLEADNDHKAVCELITKALVEFPNSSELLAKRSYAYYNLNEYEKSLADAELALKISPLEAYPHLYRGAALDSLGRKEEAALSYKAALELQPYLSSVYTLYASCLNYLNRRKEALAVLDQGINVSPEDSALYGQRALVYENLAEFPLAIQSFTEAIRLDQSNPSLRRLRCEAYLLMGCYDEAIADGLEATSLDSFESTGFALLSNAYLLKGDMAASDKYFHVALNLGSEDANLYCHRGYYFLLKSDMEAGLACFERSLEASGVVASKCYAAVQLHLLRRRLGRASNEAQLVALLNSCEDDWAASLLRYGLGQISYDALWDHSQQGSPRQVQRHLCELYYYTGQMYSIQGDKSQAMDAFKKSMQSQQASMAEYWLSAMELKQNEKTR